MPTVVVYLIARVSAEQRSLQDRPCNRPDNKQRGNGSNFQLSEIVMANAANCWRDAGPTNARGVESIQEIHTP
jgi:hypothetical protein